jgi:hypothetical protein
MQNLNKNADVEEEHEETVDEPAEEQSKTTRSGRIVKKPTRYVEQEHMILHQRDRNSDQYIQYYEDVAIVAARTIDFLNYQVSQKGASFSQQYILQCWL